MEAALADGVSAIASAMMRARPDDLPALAERMGTLARELEAPRLARSKVIDPDAERERRRR
ncbi:MAG: hypothetical protein KF894_29955 [Labilithrix sp.]|nr:hypothetical protein [Labilithrix sp.]